MQIRLGDTEIGLFRYLGLWTAVVIVFAVQRSMYDSLDGPTWSASTTYLVDDPVVHMGRTRTTGVPDCAALHSVSGARCACANSEYNCPRALA